MSQVPGAFMNWSNPHTWASGVVPQAGDTVQITNDMSVYLDISPPPLHTLIVDGQLHFLDIKNLTLIADGIAVFGDMQVRAGGPHVVVTVFGIVFARV